MAVVFATIRTPSGWRGLGRLPLVDAWDLPELVDAAPLVEVPGVLVDEHPPRTAAERLQAVLTGTDPRDVALCHPVPHAGFGP